jgi:hypothetical protein
MKVVINKCYGGFGLSHEAIDTYCKAKGISAGKWNDTWEFFDGFSSSSIERNDPVLVDIVESMGEKASGRWADLHIVEIPDDVEWCIEEYDGKEWIAEVHRTWS